jgi:tetratricopeptide (TPR) repeat protein
MRFDSKSIAEDVDDAFAKLKTSTDYEILGVARDATEKSIRLRFRELAKKYHADRYGGMGLPAEVLAKMTDLLGRISRAHSTLTNPTKRSEYDATLAMQAAGVPTDVKTILEAETHFKAGETLLEAGRFRLALERLDAACKLNPAEPEFGAVAAYCKYFTLPRDRKTDQATDRAMTKAIINHINTFLQEHTNNDKVCNYLGIIAKAEGEEERAMEYFQEALAVNPKNIVAARELRLHETRKKKGFFKRLFGSGK